MNSIKKTVEEWKMKGFSFEAYFDGEYILMLNRDSMHSVRIYLDGSVWLKTDGEYKKLEDAK